MNGNTDNPQNPGSHIGTGYATNPQGFSGGTDASNFRFVQQSDIDRVTTALSKQVTPATRAMILLQIKPDERMAGDIQCTPHISSNHNANAHANDITVKFSTTCSVLLYNQQNLRLAAMAAYKANGQTHFGAGYALVGGMQIGLPVPSNVTVDSAQFTFQINGIWSFQWTSQRQRELLQQIAGKPQDDAMQLLSERKDIQNVRITGNSFPGNALPASPTAIQLIIVKVEETSVAPNLLNVLVRYLPIPVRYRPGLVTSVRQYFHLAPAQQSA